MCEWALKEQWTKVRSHTGIQAHAGPFRVQTLTRSRATSTPAYGKPMSRVEALAHSRLDRIARSMKTGKLSRTISASIEWMSAAAVCPLDNIIPRVSRLQSSV